METREDEKANLVNGKIKPHHQSYVNSTNWKGTLNFILLPSLWFVFLFFWLSHNKTIHLIQSNQNSTPQNLDITAATNHTTPVATTNYSTTLDPTTTATNHTTVDAGAAAATTTTTNLADHNPARASTTTTTRKSICQNSVLAFYIYNLPSKFNNDFHRNCKNLNKYTNMCPYLSNEGLGQSLPNMLPSTNSSPTPSHWYSTHQFIAEVIFHSRLKNHPCRVHDPSQAKLFYVPFYGGLYASNSFRQKNHTIRDALATELSSFLVKQQTPYWRNHNGKDHFMAIGRTSWDFMRPSNIKPTDDFGANNLFNLPSIKNMSAVLTVERHPWAKNSNQFAIPYPSYFHPKTTTELNSWQNHVRFQNRPHLFSFVGGTRKGVDEKGKIRNLVINQCRNSSKCKILDCSSSGSSVGKCYVAREVINVMMSSKFCLQAPGDSYTRRSTFDSILTGCIPVFFSRHTAYSQYYWYLGAGEEDYREYSVFIDLDESGSSVEEVLGRIEESKVREMRDKVLSLLPNVTYMHPEAEDYEGSDAVDVALERVSDIVRSNFGFTAL